MHFTISIVSSVILLLAQIIKILTASCHWILEALPFQLDLCFTSAAVKHKSNAVGFNLKLFNSVTDIYCNKSKEKMIFKSF